MDKNRDSFLLWKEEKRTPVIRDRWIDFRKSDYRFPDGELRGPFYTYSRRNYVVIVSFDTEGQVLLVRQFRQGIGRITAEFPAGAIEESDAKENDSDTAAKRAAIRELLEETGYEAGRLEHLLTIPSDATICDNLAHLFLARDCKRVKSQALDEAEFVELERVSPDRIDRLSASGEFAQAVHLLAWLLAKEKISSEER